MGRVNRAREGGAVCLSYTSLVYPASSEFIRGMTSASLVILALSGCATTLPDPITIKIPVPTPCVTTSELPSEPQISSNADLANMDDGQLVLTLASERLDLKRYHGEASAILQACVQ